ncbi:hypothetical protein PORY_000876 [Pneumocystis oryctolagi]|uniref:Uncharacterized protein n=1 Tax=Pneumocystis oryctolagi TaxID=42067 RepID=A0ACB7CEG0_9ASCO|nr:hypothetical protein PORY_000876 [Pneumocystis oryctolagi]
MSCFNKELPGSFFFKEGDLLGGFYTVIGVLNHGSYGIVLLARDLENVQVAIKVLYSQSVLEHKTELEILSTLPPSVHTVSYKTYFYEKSYLFIVLEYYPYGDLYEAIVSNGLLRDTEAIRSLMLQLIDGVSFLHKNGIYHRDLKPENILLFCDPVNRMLSPRIGDFGLATTQKFVNDVGTGSNRYMAPEQYEVPVFHSSGVYYYDASKVDIWALGICLLNIIFSKNPFKTPSDSDLIYLDYIRDPASFFDVFPNMSEDTFKCLQYSLVLSPEKRSLEKMRSAVESVHEWTTDFQYIEENIVDKKPKVFSCGNISAIETRGSLRTPSFITPSTCYSPFVWTKGLKSSLKIQDKNSDSSSENEQFVDTPSFLFHDVNGNDMEKGEVNSIGSLDSGLRTGIGSYLSINQTKATDDRDMFKKTLDTSTNIIFPTSVKGSKSHLLFGRSWADDESSDDEFKSSLSTISGKLSYNINESVEDVVKKPEEKDDDHCLWMLTLEDNILYL